VPKSPRAQVPQSPSAREAKNPNARVPESPSAREPECQRARVPKVLEQQLKIMIGVKNHYCHTDLTVDSNDITMLVSGEQKHYFHLWELQKPLVAFATLDFFRPHS
jgi:hypothetical protein